MKKAIYMFLVIACAVLSLFFVGCKGENGDNGGLDLKDAYQKEWKEYIDSNIPSEVSSNVILDTEYTFADGSMGLIEWETSNAKSITTRGKYLKNILDGYITLTSKVTVVDVEEFAYEYKVFVKGEMTPEEYANEVAKTYLPDSVYTSVEFPSEENKIFANYGAGFIGTITYKSTDENTLGSDGKYNTTSASDTNVTINFTVSIGGFEVTGSKQIKVLGRDDQKRINHALEWVNSNWYSDERVQSDIEFPLTDDEGMVSFVWESNNKDIIDDAGKFHKFVLDTEVHFTLNIKMNETIETKDVVIKTIAKEDIVKYILDRMHVDEVNQSYFVTYVISKGYKNEDFGFLNFYYQDLDESQIVLKEVSDKVYEFGTNKNAEGTKAVNFNLGMASMSQTCKRPLESMKVEFITIHDTGDNKFNAAEWANEVQTSEREASWHFTTDDNGIYQQFPITECAWHAGDWPTKYQLVDTGVKYTVSKPVITVDENDGYFYINGVKSRIIAPKDNGKIVTDITPAGIYTELGANGNYYMNDTHYDSSYKKIANNGGNKNGIGIETCIYDGVKYSKVMRNTANLVAHLLVMNGLDTSRVLQHRSFSGKLCPQSMIRADENTQFAYDYFMELVEIEYFILTNMKGLKLTYTSNNPDIVDNEGTILKYVSEKTEVSYTVKAEFEGKTYEYTYKTVINPITE